MADAKSNGPKNPLEKDTETTQQDTQNLVEAPLTRVEAVALLHERVKALQNVLFEVVQTGDDLSEEEASVTAETLQRAADLATRLLPQPKPKRKSSKAKATA